MTRNMKILAASLGSLAVLGTGTAYAQARESRPDMTRAAVEQRAAEMFAKMDANSDGRIDEADRAARMQARFDRIDADDSGAISPDEFAAMHAERGGERAERGKHRRGGHHGMRGGMRGAMMGNADTDGNGAITQAEFSAAMLARFDAADSDGDGTISAAERKAQYQDRRSRMQRPSTDS